jgi:energy-coupling factor transporter ATP-binding protein EcfA2
VPQSPVIQLRRIQVEEGFLDGLDLTFAPGLNVLIGSRGVGKTSIIELLRYCLTVPALAERTDAQARQHALSVLRGGRVVVTYDVDGDPRVISRSAEDEPRPGSPSRSFVILSQNEIEQVGKEEAGRLALLDTFVLDPEFEHKTALLAARLQSMTAELRDILDEAESIQSQLSERAHAEDELAAAEVQQKELMEVVAATAADQQHLDQLQRAIAASSTQEAMFQRTASALETWREQLRRLQAAAPRVEDWPSAAGPQDRLDQIRARISQAATGLTRTMTEVSGALDELQRLQAEAGQGRASLSQEAREIRMRLEEMQKGAGEVARRVTELRELAGQASALRDLLKERTDRSGQVVRDRREVYEQMVELRDRRAAARQNAARSLEASLGPRISVVVSRSEGLDQYASAVAAALRGSGLHYSTLAQTLADTMSPRELVELVETGDARGLAEAAGIPLERAAKAVDSLRRSGAETIIAAPINDRVSLRLQTDQATYRPSEDLSTGQRCTVILPIVLSQHGRPLVVDQPEDNLDNAFVADTVVPALRGRSADDQLILATHNPNIPVLGEADRVVVLESDGSRGWVAHAGALLEAESISAITSIMEGGAEAFSARAKLYGLP